MSSYTRSSGPRESTSHYSSEACGALWHPAVPGRPHRWPECSVCQKPICHHCDSLHCCTCAELIHRACAVEYREEHYCPQCGIREVGRTLTRALEDSAIEKEMVSQ